MRERVDRYLSYLGDEEGYSQNTVAAYRNDLSQFISWLQGPGRAKRSWREVGEPEVTQYLFYLRGREYAASTVARKMAALKSFFGHLAERGEIDVDPAAEINTPRVQKSSPQALTREGISRLMAEPARLKNSKGLRDRAMLELLYATGIRVSELVNLAVEDMDLSGGYLQCGEGQNARRVPVGVRAVGPLRDYLVRGRSKLLRDESETTLFLNMRGKRLTRQGLWLIIKNYVERAGIQTEVTPHTLRHSFAIHHLKEGVELSEVKELLGHANISTTQAYTQGREELA